MLCTVVNAAGDKRKDQPRPWLSDEDYVNNCNLIKFDYGLLRSQLNTAGPTAKPAAKIIIIIIVIIIIIYLFINSKNQSPA